MVGAESKDLLKRAMREIRENGLNLAVMLVSVSMTPLLTIDKNQGSDESHTQPVPPYSSLKLQGLLLVSVLPLFFECLYAFANSFSSAWISLFTPSLFDTLEVILQGLAGMSQCFPGSLALCLFQEQH